ncbi:MAG: MFS transporter [Rhodospirillales bacterium]|nr:MFS transporter [Rhodospirillales bacterium]
MTAGNGGKQPGGAGEDVAFVPPPRKQATAALICVLLCMFLCAVCQTLVATILPLIVADLGGFERYTWAATSYLVAATLAYPIVGSLSDVFGRRRFLVAGIAVFLLGSLLVGASRSMEEVIAFRAIQGVGGGIVMTCCYVSIADLFAPAERGKYQGMIAAVYGVASLIGPLLGGVLADLISWKGAFLCIGLAGVPLLWLAVRTYPHSKRPTLPRKLDFPGMVLLALAVVPILSALSVGGVQYEWTAPEVIVPLIFGLVMAAVLLAIESKAELPIIPLGIFAHRAVALALLTMFLISLGLHGSVLMLPLYFQSVIGASVPASGALLVPMLIAIVVGGIVSGQMISRMNGGYRAQAMFHTGLFAAGMYLLSTIDRRTTLLVTEAYVVIAGIGIGGIVSTLSLAVQNSVPHAVVGAATSALQFFRSLGGMMGMAVLGAIMTRSFAARLDASVPDDIVGALSAEQFERLKAEPDALINPDAAESLAANLWAARSDGPKLAERLLNALESALTSALNDVFALVAILASLALFLAFFLRVPSHPRASET